MAKKKTYKLKKVNFAPVAVTTFAFPPEIEHVIFQWATLMYPRDGATLSVLCRRIRPYVESVIYESLLVASNEHATGIDLARTERILPTLMSRPSTFFAACVRSLWIRPDVSLETASLILSKCTAVRHLAVTLYVTGWVPMVVPTSHTLISLHIGKHTAQEMAQCGISFPNLMFLTLHYHPAHMRIGSLEWIPSVRTVLLELDYLPFICRDRFIQDVETTLSTSPRLQLLILNAAGDAMPIVMEYIKGRKIAQHIRVAFSNNMDMELEWMRLYKGKNRF